MTEVYRLLQKVAYFQVFNNKNDIIKSNMSELRFVEDNEFHIKSRRLLGEPTTPSMIRFLLRTGIAKNEKQALFVLIGIVVAVLGLTFYLANVMLIGPKGSDYIEDRFGNQYTTEQYIELLKQGKDPLSPSFQP